MSGVDDVKMMKNILQLASGNFNQLEKIQTGTEIDGILKETKAILTIMNEGIKRKRSKEPINVYAIEESCQILAEAFQRRNKKEDDVNTDNEGGSMQNLEESKNDFDDIAVEHKNIFIHSADSAKSDDSDIEISKDNIAEDLKLLVLASLGDTVGINQLAIKFKKINERSDMQIIKFNVDPKEFIRSGTQKVYSDAKETMTSSIYKAFKKLKKYKEFIRIDLDYKLISEGKGEQSDERRENQDGHGSKEIQLKIDPHRLIEEIG